MFGVQKNSKRKTSIVRPLSSKPKSSRPELLNVMRDVENDDHLALLTEKNSRCSRIKWSKAKVLCCSPNPKIAWPCRVFLLLTLGVLAFVATVAVRAWPLTKCQNCIAIRSLEVGNMTTSEWTMLANGSVSFPAKFQVQIHHVDTRIILASNCIAEAGVDPRFQPQSDSNSWGTELSKGEWSLEAAGILNIKSESLTAQAASNIFNRVPFSVTVETKAHISTREFLIPISMAISTSAVYRCDIISHPDKHDPLLRQDRYYCGWDTDFSSTRSSETWESSNNATTTESELRAVNLQYLQDEGEKVVVEGKEETAFSVNADFMYRLGGSFIVVHPPPLSVWMYGDTAQSPILQVTTSEMVLRGSLAGGEEGNNFTVTACIPSPVTATAISDLQEMFETMYRGRNLTVWTYPQSSTQSSSSRPIHVCGDPAPHSVAQSILNQMRIALPLPARQNSTSSSSSSSSSSGSRNSDPNINIHRLDLLGINRTDALVHLNLTFDATSVHLERSKMPPVVFGMWSPTDSKLIASVFIPSFETSGGQSADFTNFLMIGVRRNIAELRELIDNPEFELRAIPNINLISTIMSNTTLFSFDPTDYFSGGAAKKSDAPTMDSVISVVMTSTTDSLRVTMTVNMTEVLTHIPTPPASLHNSVMAIGDSEIGVYDSKKRRVSRLQLPGVRMQSSPNGLLIDDEDEIYTSPDGLVSITFVAEGEECKALQDTLELLQLGKTADISVIHGTLNLPIDFSSEHDTDGTRDPFDSLIDAPHALPLRSLRTVLEIAGRAIYTKAWNGSEVVDEIQERIGVSDIHIVGGGAGEGSPIRMPCVFDSICAKETSLNLSQALMYVDVSLGRPFWPDWLSLDVEMPSFQWQLSCCFNKPVGTVDMRVRGVRMEPTRGLLRMEVLGSLYNIPLIRAAINKWLGKIDLDVGIAPPNPPPNFLSSLITTTYSFDIPATSSMASSAASASTSSLSSSAYIPLQVSGSWSIYDSGSNHLTWLIQPPHQSITWNLSAPFILGNLSANLNYNGTSVAHLAMHGGDLVLNPGNDNHIDLLATIHGTDQASTDPACAKLNDKRQCTLVIFLSSLLASQTVDAQLVVQFYNSFGSLQTMTLDMKLLETPEVRFDRDYVLPTASPYMVISGLKTDIASTIYNSATFWKSINIICRYLIQNSYNFDFKIWTASVDIKYNDPNGFENALSPKTYPPAYGLTLVNGMSMDCTAEGGLSVKAGTSVWSKEVAMSITENKSETLARLYDEVYVNGRLCSQLENGNVVVEFKAPSKDSFFLQQIFNIKDYPLIGFTDCYRPTNCSEQVRSTLSLPSFTSSNIGLLTFKNTNGVRTPTLSSGRIVLTDGFGQQSSTWFNTKQPVLDSFEVRFDFTIQKTYSLVQYSEGFAFVLQNSSSGIYAYGSACDTGRSCYGYKGIPFSIAVVFNVYVDNTISIYRNGDFSNPIAITGAYGSLTGNTRHYVIVKYEALPKHLNVYIQRGSPFEKFPDAPQLSCDLDLTTISSSGSMYTGFTASTGSVTASNIQIGSFSYGTCVTDATTTRIDEDGSIIGFSGQLGLIHIDARSSCGAPRLVGGDVWRLVLNHTVSHEIDMIPISNITDTGMGRYSVDMWLPRPGTHVVWGSVNGGASGPLGFVIISN